MKFFMLQDQIDGENPRTHAFGSDKEREAFVLEQMNCYGYDYLDASNLYWITDVRPTKKDVLRFFNENVRVL